jgi:hypothetical protein
VQGGLWSIGSPTTMGETFKRSAGWFQRGMRRRRNPCRKQPSWKMKRTVYLLSLSGPSSGHPPCSSSKIAEVLLPDTTPRACSVETRQMRFQRPVDPLDSPWLRQGAAVAAAERSMFLESHLGQTKQHQLYLCVSPVPHVPH